LDIARKKSDREGKRNEPKGTKEHSTSKKGHGYQKNWIPEEEAKKKKELRRKRVSIHRKHTGQQRNGKRNTPFPFPGGGTREPPCVKLPKDVRKLES